MFSLKKNIGRTQRIIRYALGIFFIAITLIYLNNFPFWLITLFTVLGIFLIVEGLLKWCVIRSIIGAAKDND